MASQAEEQLPSYYTDLGLENFTQHIKNFDIVQNFDNLEKLAKNASSRNFIIDFGHDEAWCGFDLKQDAWVELLKAPVSYRRK